MNDEGQMMLRSQACEAQGMRTFRQREQHVQRAYGRKRARVVRRKRQEWPVIHLESSGVPSSPMPLVQGSLTLRNPNSRTTSLR